MDKIHIREAALADIDKIQKLYKELFMHMAELQPGSYRECFQDERFLRETIAAGDSLLLIANDGEGFALIQEKMTEYDCLVPHRYAYLVDIAVTAEKRGQGIGTSMIQQAAKWARERGLEYMELSVLENNDQAMTLYTRLGFKPVSRTLRLELAPPADIWQQLYKAAAGVRNARPLTSLAEAGAVGAAILTDRGNIYTGVCIDTACSLGMCAERNAAANMITCGENKIEKIVAVMGNGRPGYPCGACCEFLMQICENAGDIEFLLDIKSRKTMKLKEIFPNWWGK